MSSVIRVSKTDSALNSAALNVYSGRPRIRESRVVRGPRQTAVRSLTCFSFYIRYRRRRVSSVLRSGDDYLTCTCETNGIAPCLRIAGDPRRKTTAAAAMRCSRRLPVPAVCPFPRREKPQSHKPSRASRFISPTRRRT